MYKFLLVVTLLFCFFDNKTYGQNNSIDTLREKWKRFGNNGQWDSAFLYATKIQTITETIYGGMSSQNAQAFARVLGITYYNHRDYLPAYNYIKKAIAIFTAINDTSSAQYIDALNNLGGICENIGAYSDGEAYLLKCSAICKRMGTPFYFYQSSISMALIYDDIGEYSKAELVYADLKRLTDTMQDMQLKAYRQMCICSNLAKIYTETGDFRKGVTYFAKAAAICRTPAFDKEYKSYDYLTVILNLAETYNSLNETDSASLQCKEAEYLLKKTPTVFTNLILLKRKG